MIVSWSELYALWLGAGVSTQEALDRADAWENERRDVDSKHELLYKQALRKKGAPIVSEKS